MGQFLVFQLYGPMAAWGDIAVGETRRSAAHPSKSAILGLLAATQGIDRDQEELHRKMAQAYGFAVKAFSLGSLLVDYHTVQVPSQKRKRVLRTRRDEISSIPLNTLLSSREYRCDAVYIIAIWIACPPPPFDLAELSESIQKPSFSLYLGRKSCPPAAPLGPTVLETRDLKTALDSYPNLPQELQRITRSHANHYYWEELSMSGLDKQQTSERRDSPLSRKRWQFSPRIEHLYVEKKET